MKNMNRATLIGQLTAAPELKESSAGDQMASFGLATNYSWKNENGEWQSGVDYHRVVAWGKHSAVVRDHLQKGDRVLIEGKIRSKSWTTEKNEKKWSTEIVATTVVPMKPIRSESEEK